MRPLDTGLADQGALLRRTRITLSAVGILRFGFRKSRDAVGTSGASNPTCLAVSCIRHVLPPVAGLLTWVTEPNEGVALRRDPLSWLL